MAEYRRYGWWADYRGDRSKEEAWEAAGRVIWIYRIIEMISDEYIYII